MALFVQRHRLGKLLQTGKRSFLDFVPVVQIQSLCQERSALHSCSSKSVLRKDVRATKFMV